MTAATQMPTWAVYAVSFGSPIAALLGAGIGHIVARVSARELEKRSRREQLMKALQWAAELAVSEDEFKANLGYNQLLAVAESDLCDKDVHAFVDAALEAVLGDLPDEVEEDPQAVIEPATALAESDQTDRLRAAHSQGGPVDLEPDRGEEGDTK